MQQASTQAPIEIIRPQAFYTVRNVWLPYANAVRDVQVTTQPLDGGKSRTVREWQEYRRQTGWGPGSGPLQYSLDESLYDNRNHPDANVREVVEELRKLRGDDFNGRLMMTATGITYRAGTSLDIVTHDFGTAGAQSLEAHLVGPDGYFGDVASGGVSEALFGEKDPVRVHDVYKWVTGRNPKLWRLNQQPKQDIERALVLGDFFNLGFGIGADGGIYDYGPARGVRIAPQNSTGSKG